MARSSRAQCLSSALVMRTRWFVDAICLCLLGGGTFSMLAITFKAVLKTRLSSTAVRSPWTADSPLRHAMLIATRHFAEIADDPAIAYFAKGTAAIGDACISLLAVAVAVGAAF